MFTYSFSLSIALHIISSFSLYTQCRHSNNFTTPFQRVWIFSTMQRKDIVWYRVGREEHFVSCFSFLASFSLLFFSFPSLFLSSSFIYFSG